MFDILSIFQFEFMRRTLLAGLLLAISLPLIGIVMINRKTSMVSDALSHVSLTGVGLGLIMGFDPVIGAIFSCIVAGFFIEIIREKMPQFGDMSVAVIMSAGLGLAVLLADFAPGGNTFESYLFGSVSAVTVIDLIAIIIVSVLVVGISIICYSALMDLAIDLTLARLAGVQVRLINSIFTLLSAIAIALACKVVGALLVVSLIALPVACALIVSRSYLQTCIIAVILGVIFTMAGLIFSYFEDVRPGGSIVVASCLGIVLFLIYKHFRVLKVKK